MRTSCTHCSAPLTPSTAKKCARQYRRARRNSPAAISGVYLFDYFEPTQWAKQPVGSGTLSDGLHVRSVPQRALAPRVFEGAQPCWRCSQPRLPVFYLRRVHCGRRCTTWDCRRSRCSATAAAGVRPSAARFVLSAARFTGFDSAGHAVFVVHRSLAL